MWHRKAGPRPAACAGGFIGRYFFPAFFFFFFFPAAYFGSQPSFACQEGIILFSIQIGGGGAEGAKLSQAAGGGRSWHRHHPRPPPGATSGALLPVRAPHRGGGKLGGLVLVPHQIVMARVENSKGIRLQSVPNGAGSPPLCAAQCALTSSVSPCAV